jgi:hypothetical protein
MPFMSGTKWTATLRVLFAISLGSLIALAACGSLDKRDSNRTPEGSSCVDGVTCERGLLCFVKENDPESGICTKPPPACDGNLACDCLDELKAQCASNSLGCFGLVGDMSAACINPGQFRKKGETCSFMVPCEGGLLCLVPKEGVAGICQDKPTGCGQGITCDCLIEAADTLCPGKGWGCMIAGPDATFQCY